MQSTGWPIMQLHQVPDTNVRLSRAALGGHDYLRNGNSRGFNQDFARAMTPGHSVPGFGGTKRRAVLAAAHDLGINFFDVTLDAEKAALGRNFAEMPASDRIYRCPHPGGATST